MCNRHLPSVSTTGPICMRYFLPRIDVRAHLALPQRCSNMTRDRNLQFPGFLAFLQAFSSFGKEMDLTKSGERKERSGRRKSCQILSRLWLSWILPMLLSRNRKAFSQFRRPPTLTSHQSEPPTHKPLLLLLHVHLPLAWQVHYIRTNTNAPS